MMGFFSDDKLSKIFCRHEWQQEKTKNKEFRVICLKCESMYQCKKCNGIDIERDDFSWSRPTCRTCRDNKWNEMEAKKRRLLGD